MMGVEKFNVSKQRILSTIRTKGPSLPVQIARAIDFSPLFASAFLSELKSEGKVSISNMRVGSSPLYYLPGQEEQLEKFVPYLNQREKEAFHLLKKESILEDGKQNPVVRVALRAIKDFAVPIKIRDKGESKLFWKYFMLKDNEVNEIIENSEKSENEPEVKESKQEKEADEISKENIKESVKEETENLLNDTRPLAEKKQAKIMENGFPIMVKDYLQTKEIEVLHVISEKKKEIEAKIRINTDLGRQTYYLLAKDKKSVSDNDLAIAEKKARAEKLPAVFISQGELNKKGRAHLEAWGNLVRFEKLEN